MATLKLLLSQARRHCLPKPPFPPFTHRLLSSVLDSSPHPNSNPDSEPPSKSSQSVPIPTVSFPSRPEDLSTPDQDQDRHENAPQAQSLLPRDQPRNSQQEKPSIWTREDIRYVKDVPVISPVSYPSRVAPLPEDRVSGERDEAMEAKEGSEEMERERKRIEADVRVRRRVFRVSEEEEKVAVPFPMLIKKKEKQEKPAPLDLMEAIRLVKANAKKNFDETIEAHVRLGIKKERTDQIVHGSLILPHGVAKDVKVAFFAEGADADEARAAGADIVGGVELIEEIASSHKFNVDKCFATPQLVLRLNKIASFLKESHLLPDRKHGTVTSDVSGAIKAARLGRIHFKMDKTSIVHVGLGKASFTDEFLRENIGAVMNALLLAKPPSLKKASKYAGYVNTFHICSTVIERSCVFYDFFILSLPEQFTQTGMERPGAYVLALAHDTHVGLFVDLGWCTEGVLNDGRKVAIKLMDQAGQQGEEEFKVEVELLSQLHSPYLLALVGYCSDDNHKLLVYEFMANGGLQEHLYPMSNLSPNSTPKEISGEDSLAMNHKYGRSCKFFSWYGPPMCSHGRRVLTHLSEKHARANMEATSSITTIDSNIASEHASLIFEVTKLRCDIESMKSKHHQELRREMESIKSKHQQERHYYKRALVLSWAFFPVCIISGFLGGSHSNEKSTLT